MRQTKRKLIKHFHRPGDLHEFTFSCYRQMQLLTNDEWRVFLSKAINDANEAYSMRLVAFVFMPEHVHLLVYPAQIDFNVDQIPKYLSTLKRPCSVQVKQSLAASGRVALARRQCEPGTRAATRNEPSRLSSFPTFN